MDPLITLLIVNVVACLIGNALLDHKDRQVRRLERRIDRVILVMRQAALDGQPGVGLVILRQALDLGGTPDGDEEHDPWNL